MRSICNICLCLVFFFVGCNITKSFSPKDIFLKKNPELSKYYSNLQPTSCESMRETVAHSSIGRFTIIQVIKESFPDNQELQEYLAELETRTRKLREEQLENLESFEKELSEDDYLYHFSYCDNKKRESGLLVLNNGNIKKRIVYVTQDLESKESD
jgi:hypothetical protein